jgi:hypothetical protein
MASKTTRNWPSYLSLQGVQALCQILARGEDAPPPDEGPHDLDVHLCLAHSLTRTLESMATPYSAKAYER